MSDLFLHDVRLPSGERAALELRGGIIRSIHASGSGGPGLPAPADLPREDGRGLLVLPGAIDMHVHFRQPGGEHKETLLTGARAAVKGGTTTCGDMPNTSPHTTTLAALAQKAALAAEAPCHLLFNFGAAPENLLDVRQAAATPWVRALKIYMGPSTGHGGLAPEHTEAHFRQAGRMGLPVMVHAEHIESIAAAEGRFPHDARHHADLRSIEAELTAVHEALRMARDHGTKLHLCHVTSARVLDLVEASGIRERVFVEVCPHHLLLSTADIHGPVENRYKVNPPLRPEPERAALLAALAARIDGLASDHAPHTLAEKRLPYDEAPSGIPGVEYVLPFALAWWAEGRYDLARLIALTSGNVARFLGLNRGALEPGREADLVLVDPDARWTLGAGDDRVASKCGWTLYAGTPLRGRPLVTLVGGRVVYRHGG
ncbi:MAG: dihydroorotase family protein [Candidatus Lambdaproteobacteria bacterium]|nr:dihydroorotase family protein [Candidatus Lambdaproteobacteria bacterium]